MQHWEWVLLADNKYDLAEGSWEHLRASGCYPTHNLFMGVTDKGISRWYDYYQRRWRACVLAFRSVVHHLKGKQTRPAARSGRKPSARRRKWAEKVFRSAIGELVPVVIPAPPGYRSSPSAPGFGNGPHSKSPRGALISKSTYVGVRMTVPFGAHFMSAMWKKYVESRCKRGASLDAEFAIDQFWMNAFGSLVADDITPSICKSCAIPLGRTPKDRAPRAAKCRKCANAEYYAAAKAANHDALKDRGRINKARQRAELAATPTKKRKGN
jgi:hypothetical protein